jgi:cation diffusion facilitator family transporter
MGHSHHAFALNHEESSTDGRKQQIAIVSSIVNILLALFKLVAGILSGSVSIISEAAHSLVDLMASLIAYVAVKQSDKPADNRHAYGHGKAENLSGAFEAFLIIVAALWIVYEAVEKIMLRQVPEYLEYGIGVMLVSIIANMWITRKLYKVARETGSSALEADALHHEADVWTSVGVFAGLILIKFTGLYWLDPVIAIGVAVIIFKAGYTMTRDNVSELMDARLPADEEAFIIQIVETNPEVKNLHALRTRRSGARRLMDMHIVLCGGMPVGSAHALCAQLKQDIVGKLGPCDILIHIEPDDNIAGSVPE